MLMATQLLFTSTIEILTNLIYAKPIFDHYFYYAKSIFTSEDFFLCRLVNRWGEKALLWPVDLYPVPYNTTKSTIPCLIIPEIINTWQCLSCLWRLNSTALTVSPIEILTNLIYPIPIIFDDCFYCAKSIFTSEGFLCRLVNIVNRWSGIIVACRLLFRYE